MYIGVIQMTVYRRRISHSDARDLLKTLCNGGNVVLNRVVLFDIPERH